jgi:hypothetical protein
VVKASVSAVPAITTAITKGVCIAIAALSLAFLSGCHVSMHQEPVDLERQEWQIKNLLSAADRELRNAVSIEEWTGEDGNPLYIGVLSDELEAVLEDLVRVYNADPSVEAQVTLEEVKDSLTIKTAETAADENENSPIRLFLAWTNEAASLVFWGDVTHSDGSVSVADSPKPGITSNYEYVLNQEDEYKDYEYSWRMSNR